MGPLIPPNREIVNAHHYGTCFGALVNGCPENYHEVIPLKSKSQPIMIPEVLADPVLIMAYDVGLSFCGQSLL